MGILDEVFDFFFGWLIPDPPKPDFQGQEVTLQKPTNAQLVYGKVFNQKGQIVRSEVIDSTVTDIPNELMYVQVVWSAGAIQSIDNVYLNEILHTDSRYQHPDGGSYVYVYNVPSGGSITFDESTAVSGGTLTFDGNGHAYSVIRLQIAPEKMPNFPNITADLSGRLIENLSTGVTEFSDNYADVLWDYLTSPYGRGIRVSRLDKPSFLAERAFTETLVDRFDGDTQQQKLMSCNVALDGNKKVLDNVNIIRKGCRGFLPYIDGKFQFIIEHERDPITFEITDDNRMGDLTIEDSALNEHYNKVTVKYRDKEQQGKEVSVVYPEDNSTYLIEDNNVPLETTVTLDTVNNEYEAKQAAEIIFNRSRNTLKAKYTCKSEGRVVNVGNVMNVSNAAFGLSQKPFIVNNKKVRASGIVEFELIEYQATIYPWVAKTEQVIPDSTIPDYSTVTPVTSLAVEYTYDELSQARVTWSSTHSSFNVFIVNSSGDRTGLGTTANKFILLDALEVGTYTVEVYAVNGLGYTSAKTQLAINITRPSTPALSSDPVGSFLYIRPVSLDVGYDYHFEFYYGLTDTGNEPNTTTLTRAPDGTFMDVVEGIVANTTYYVYHRIVTRFGNGAWIKNTVVSGDGIPLSQLEPNVQTSISRASSGAELDQAISQISDDLIVQNQNVEIAIANKAIDDIFTIISQGRVEIENLTEIGRLNGIVTTLDQELGKITVEGGQITASEIAALQVEIDAFNAEITAVVAKQTEIDGTVTTNVAEIQLLSSGLTALQTTIGGLDFDALVLRMDGAENAIEQSAISATTSNIDGLSDIITRGIDAIELIEATENLALAQTKIQANTTDIEATASQVTTVATVANDGYALAQSALSSVSNESEQRASDVTLLQAEIDDRKAEINEVSQALVDETSARATDVSTLQANIDNEAGTRAAEITTVNDAITTESQARASADTTLQANINTEAGTRAAEISSVNTAIADETSARASADTTLQANIDTEAGTRAAAITSVNQAIANESSARASLETTLQADINGRATLTQLQAVEDKADGNTTVVNNINGQVNNPTNGLSAAFNLAQEAKDTADGTASSITEISNTINHSDTGLSATLSLATTAKDRTEHLASFALETDVNGFTSGIYNQNDGTTASFKIRTNEFEIVDSISGDVVLNRNATSNTWEFDGDLKAAGGTFTGNLAVGDFLISQEGFLRTDEPTSTNTRAIVFGGNYTSEYTIWIGEGEPTDDNAKLYVKRNTGDLVLRGSVEAASGDIGGWEIEPTVLRSAGSGARIELNSDQNRISIFDVTNEKVVMGYLDGLPKNSGGGSWGGGDYGFWARNGDKLVIDGDTEYVSGDWIVENDATVRIHNASGNDVLSLGTDNGGEKGLFLFDGSVVRNLLSKFTTNEIYIGDGSSYLQYQGGNLTFTGTLSGADGEFTGTVNAGTIDGGRILTPSINTNLDGSGDTTKSYSLLDDGTFIIRSDNKLLLFGTQAGANDDYLLWLGDPVSKSQRTLDNALFAADKDGNAKFGGKVNAGEVQGDLIDFTTKTIVESTTGGWAGGVTVERTQFTFTVAAQPFAQLVKVGGVHIFTHVDGLIGGWNYRLYNSSGGLLDSYSSTFLSAGQVIMGELFDTLPANTSRTYSVKVQPTVNNGSSGEIVALMGNQKVPISVSRVGGTIS